MPDATHEPMTDEQQEEIRKQVTWASKAWIADYWKSEFLRLLDEVRRLRAENRRLQDEIKRDNLEIRALMEELDKKEDEEC